jgi:hypothetical protein
MRQRATLASEAGRHRRSPRTRHWLVFWSPEGGPVRRSNFRTLVWLPVAMTLDRYGHLLEGLDADVATRLEGLRKARPQGRRGLSADSEDTNGKDPGPATGTNDQ